MTNIQPYATKTIKLPNVANYIYHLSFNNYSLGGRTNISFSDFSFLPNVADAIESWQQAPAMSVQESWLKPLNVVALGAGQQLILLSAVIEMQPKNHQLKKNKKMQSKMLCFSFIKHQKKLYFDLPPVWQIARRKGGSNGSCPIGDFNFCFARSKKAIRSRVIMNSNCVAVV